MKIKKPRHNCRGFHFHSTLQKRTTLQKFLLLKIFATEIPFTTIFVTTVRTFATPRGTGRLRASYGPRGSRRSATDCSMSCRRTVAPARRGRQAWRKLGKIDGLGGSAGKGKKRPNQ